MGSTNPDPQFNDDGTLRRRYELDEGGGGRSVLGVVIGLALANAVALLKNIFYGTEPPKSAAAALMAATDAAPDEFPERSDRHPADTIENVLLRSIADDADPSPTAFTAAPTFETFLSVTSGTFNASGPLSSAPMAHVTSGALTAGNDNASLYGTTPGQAIALPHEAALSASAGREPAGIAADARKDGAVVKLVTPSQDDPVPDGSAPPATGDASAAGASKPGGDDAKRNANRLPVVSGPVFLGTMMSDQMLVIALSDLLSHATDPDGDALTVTDLTVSSGTVEVRAESGIVMLSDVAGAIEITFSYGVSDGLGETPETASLTLVPGIAAPIYGTAGDDRLVGTPHDDVIDALAGDDIVVGLTGNDVIDGGSGNDRIVSGDGDDVVHGGDGDDVVFAGAGNDVVYGGNGNDVLFGEDGNDVLFGEAGDDTISGGAGADTLDGGTGNDQIDGGSGNDVILGGAGNDAIDGGEGDDAITGGTGSDVVGGGAGNDTFIAVAGDGNDLYVGGDGQNTYDASATTAALMADLKSGVISSADVGTDKVAQIQNVVGGGGDDDITGDGAANTLSGGAGDDFIDGDAGNDRLEGDAGDDEILGGEGDDTIIVTVGDGSDRYDGGQDVDTLDLSRAGTTGIAVDLTAGTASSLPTPAAGTADASPVGTAAVAPAAAAIDTSAPVATTIAAATLPQSAPLTTIDAAAAAHAADHGATLPSAPAEAAGTPAVIGTAESTSASEPGQHDATPSPAPAPSAIEVHTEAAASVTAVAPVTIIAAPVALAVEPVVVAAQHAEVSSTPAGTTSGAEAPAVPAVLPAVATIHAAATDIGHDTLASIENVIGSAGPDKIIGSAAANVIAAGAGDDDVATGGGDDTIVAAIGDGDDKYDGGSGHDTLDLSATKADAVVDLEGGKARSADIGHDEIAGIENVKSGSGNDVIVAGNGVNVLVGGAGNDTFVFGSVAAIGKGHGNRDQILDFEVGDRIDLEEISKEFAAAVDNAFGGHGIAKFVLIAAQDKFTTPGEMKVSYESNDGHAVTILQGNINFDDQAEFELELAGTRVLHADDFGAHA